MNTEKLKTKDIISIVLMSLLNIVIFGFSSFLYLSPITILLMPVYLSLAQGIVYFMLGAKVQKKGAMFIYCVIQGVIAFNIPYIICFVISGILAEIILKKTGYGDAKGLCLSYVLMQLIASIGSTIYPYAITLEATLARMPSSGSSVNSQYIAEAGHMIQSWGSLVLLVVVALSALLGAFFGKKVMQRHLLKVKNAQADDEE